MLDDIGRVLAEVKPDAVRILMPEQTYDDSYARIAPRATLETLVRLGAHRAGVPVEMLHRNSARARLGLPRGGKFDGHLPAAIGGAGGEEWGGGGHPPGGAAPPGGRCFRGGGKAN